MSQRNRQTVQQRSALEEAISVVPDHVVAARPTAEDEREWRGDTLLRDWKPHDLVSSG